jgi:8-oxo-dGTP diphosphatase
MYRHPYGGTTVASQDYTATLPRKRMAAGVLFRDPAGRVLLVEPTYKDHWEIPGGSVGADESPYDAAQREVKEELDLAVRPGRLLAVDWVPARPGGTEGVMVVFDGGVLSADRTAEIRLPADELRSWAWCTVEEARTRLSGLLARRVDAARRAQVDGTTCYLEFGHPVPA